MGVHTGYAHREIVLVASTIVLVQVSQEGHNSLSSQWGADNMGWCFEVMDTGFAPVAAEWVIPAAARGYEDPSTWESAGGMIRVSRG
jgi:hypothetical protein